MEKLAWLFTVAALVLFLMAAFGVGGRVAWGWLGMAVLASYVVLAGLPAAVS